MTTETYGITQMALPRPFARPADECPCYSLRMLLLSERCSRHMNGIADLMKE
jgi:hypothetical protein